MRVISESELLGVGPAAETSAEYRKWTVLRGEIFTSSAPLLLGALSCETL